jgi:periplasmic copper chaperone A
MQRLLIIFGAMLSLGACGPQEPLAIRHAEFRPPLGSTDIGAAYFTIRSEKADRIVAVSSSLADAVEIHASVTNGDRVSMQRLETLELPAGKTVRFEPGGMHLMVISPRSEASAKAFPITIELQSGTKETVAFEKVAGAANHPS